MEITVEISYYSLTEDYKTPVKEFLEEMTRNGNLKIETGVMSTMITGEYDQVMPFLDKTIRSFMEKYPSVFSLKIANACNTCKTKDE
jgi:uncharacterized protein YqgV (UPF0045/DUF77 family)